MHVIFQFLLIAFSASSLFSATVQFQTTFLGTVNGQSQFRNIYTLTDTALQANQAVDIDFDPALFGALSNPQGPNLSILALQPNNPPGTAGLLSALAQSSTQPPISFSVSFIFLGTGQPSSQPFAINQYNSQGTTLVSTITSGVTTPEGFRGIPEPGGFALAGLGLLAISGWRRWGRPPVCSGSRNK